MSLPKLDVKALDADRRDDGVVLLAVGRSTRAIRKVSEYEAVIAIDRQGEIAWRREFDFCVMDCRRSARETLLVMATDGRIAEIGLDGAFLQQWYCAPRFPEGLDGIPLETEKLHHTIAEPEPGLLLSLSVERLPLERPDGEWAHFMGDTVVLFGRDGRVEREFSLAGLLDPRRMGYGRALLGQPGLAGDPRLDARKLRGRRPGRQRNPDLPAPPGSRDQDSPGRRTGLDIGRPERLARGAGREAAENRRRPAIRSPARSELRGERRPYALRQRHGRRDAARPGTADRRSFALAYAINERAMTATETWRYGDIPYSHYVSGVCETPNGNRFVACTGLCHAPDGARVEIPPQGVGSIALKEVSPDGDVVFHAEIRDADAAPDRGWNGFRPEYLPREFSERLR